MAPTGKRTGGLLIGEFEMIVGIIQARMSSTRLPGKVLLPIAGKPMLARQIERLQRARRIDQLLIATTADDCDDAIADLGEELGIAVNRGSVDDVLDRFYQAAKPLAPSYVVRLTADCPLCDWELIDALVDFGLDRDCDYASNTLRLTWPDGLDAELLRFSALEEAWREALNPVEREHVTPFIIAHPERFTQASFEGDVNLSAMRWTVDEQRDYAFVAQVYDELYPRNRAFTTSDILKLLIERPELAEVNAGIERNEGLRRSIERSTKEDAGD